MMPRRIQIQMACQRCRKKRAKCDGKAICQRCDEAGQVCVYDHHNRRESNDTLCAEIDRLRKSNDEHENLLKAISSSQYPKLCNTLLGELLNGSKSRRAILQELTQMGSDSGRPRDAIHLQPLSNAHATNPRGNTCPHCLRTLPLPTRCHSFSDLDLFAEASDAASTVAKTAPSSLCFDSGATQSQTDPWTRIGWPMALVRQLFDVILTWDYLPFCLLCRDPFLQDYYSGSTKYCSSALVNALLALATRLIKEHDDEAGPLAPSWARGMAFFNEAESFIQAGLPSCNLPDIQALGILSLYQISCERETEAQELAEAFFARITGLCLREPLAAPGDDQYVKVRATTYCGAVSLLRILRMATSQLFSLSTNLTLEDDSIFLDQASCRNRSAYNVEHSVVAPAAANLMPDVHNSQLCNLQLIPAKVFQLTEWVYKFLAAARLPNSRVVSEEVLVVYTKCLDWYDGFFPLLKPDGSETPFFIHMYYQFCLLCLFRPFINLAFPDSGIRPHEICEQAAQSILALSQSHGQLFTLRRVPALVPYFVCAAGLNASSMIKTELSEVGGSFVFPNVISPSLSPITMPAVAHARQLLAEMSPTRRVAPLAERMLRGRPTETNQLVGNYVL